LRSNIGKQNYDEFNDLIWIDSSFLKKKKKLEMKLITSNTQNFDWKNSLIAAYNKKI